MPKWTQEELTCPECGQVFRDKRGLNGHRMFKHGVHPSAPQLPLQKQDLLISESKLEQLLDARFAVISEQVDALTGELEQLTKATKGDGAALALLDERVTAAESKSIDDFTAREKAEFLIPWMQELSGEDFVRLAINTGHDAQLVPAVAPELAKKVAETFRQQGEEAKAKAEKEPDIVQGKVAASGWKYLEHMDVSVREGAKGMPEVIKGKTTEPGYRYLEHLDVSVRE